MRSLSAQRLTTAAAVVRKNDPEYGPDSPLRDVGALPECGRPRGPDSRAPFGSDPCQFIKDKSIVVSVDIPSRVRTGRLLRCRARTDVGFAQLSAHEIVARVQTDRKRYLERTANRSKKELTYIATREHRVEG
jgi:hypothetical protein